MHFPQPGDYIDIHVHGGKPATGIFILESLMAHEDSMPVNIPGAAYTYGIHPWFLNSDNHDKLIRKVQDSFNLPGIIAIGEAGFDKLRGPSSGLQRITFEEQVIISEEVRKPVIVHCVRAWDELLSVRKKLKPRMPWMVHGFRGNIKLASQLISKGMYLSVWFEFAVRPESRQLLRDLPPDRMFLETDGADVDIRKIYEKVAGDRCITVDEMKSVILDNFNTFFSNITS
jgi:TatD DNase family protein